VYLNVIEWGNGIYGAEAAARRYYKTSAAKLNRDQAARKAARPCRIRAGRPTAARARIRSAWQ
jgi:membrane carboxypeptidase/penicillin-binding protein PbpC